MKYLVLMVDAGEAPAEAPAPRAVEELAAVTPSPYVELNGAIAAAMAFGPELGLARLDALAGSGALEGYHLLPAAQADLLRRAGRPEEAAAAYRRALETVSHAAEREYLERRLAEVSASSALDPTQPNRDPAAFSLRSPSPGPGEGEGGSR